MNDLEGLSTSSERVLFDENIYNIMLLPFYSAPQCSHCKRCTSYQSREWVDRSWVMGQMGHGNRMGHMGHGSLGVDP